MHVLSVALQVAGLLADEPTAPVPVPGSSAVAQIITVTLAGIAAIITAAAGFNGLRKRRQADADAAPAAAEIVIPVDMEDRPSRLRERLTALETTSRTHAREIDDLKEAMTLRRAADIIYESEQAPRRRPRRAAE